MFIQKRILAIKSDFRRILIVVLMVLSSNQINQNLMKVTVEAPKFDADAKLTEFIKKRVAKLEHFYDKIIHTDVYLKLEPNVRPNNKIVELLVSVPGDEFIVKKMAKSFEEATDTCVQAMERMLLKRKEKIRSRAS